VLFLPVESAETQQGRRGSARYTQLTLYSQILINILSILLAGQRFRNVSSIFQSRNGQKMHVNCQGTLALLMLLVLFVSSSSSIFDDEWPQNKKNSRISMEINQNNFRDDEDKKREWEIIVQDLGNGLHESGVQTSLSDFAKVQLDDEDDKEEIKESPTEIENPEEL
jgi:hypothetical protein